MARDWSATLQAEANNAKNDKERVYDRAIATTNRDIEFVTGALNVLRGVSVDSDEHDLKNAVRGLGALKALFEKKLYTLEMENR